MMMKKYSFLSYITLFAVIFILFSGCRKEEDLSERVNKIDFNNGIYTIDNDIDQWLFDSLTVPYNIRVKYKWDRSELDLDKTITPVEESRVIPLAQQILKYFIEPYKKVAGSYFIKRYPPKQYLFIGSAKYNSNGTQTTGTADAGRKIILYRINGIDWGDWNTIQRVLKTIQHEFAHILDQNRPVPVEYGQISKADYVEDLWHDNSEQDALNQGFITPYASSVSKDDFAEMVAILLNYGQEYFDLKVSTASSEGQEILRKKEKMVKDYYSLSWNLDFDSLQYQIQKDMPEAPLPPFLEYYGDGLQYGTIVLDDNSVTDGFRPIWEEAEAETATSGRELSYIHIEMMPSGNQLYFKVYRYKSGSSGSSSYRRLYMDLTTDADGFIHLSYTSNSEDGNSSSSTVKGWLEDNILDFLENNRFMWRFRNILQSEGGLFVVDNDGNRTGEEMTGGLE